jgi:hypothetical protein
MYTSFFRKAMLGDTATLALDFSTGTMPTAVTFTRADSTARATYIDASGYVKTVTAAGDPRFDYTGGVAKGLLIEAAATNLCLQGRYCYDGGSLWGANANININSVLGTANSPIARINGPDNGTLTGTSITKNFGVQYERLFTNVTVTASEQYTYSMWLRAGTNGATYFRLAPFNGGTPLTTVGSCNDPAVTIDNASGFGSRFSNVPSDRWVRVSVVFTTASLQTSVVLAVYPNVDTTAAVENYIWGAQLELGAAATSTIPTTTATLARLADDAVISGTAWTSLYAQPGAMVVEFYRGAYGAGDRSIMSTDPTATRHWHLKNANASATAQIAFSAGSPVTQTGLTAGLNKVAIAWNAPTPTASFDLCVNGATPTFGGSNVGTTLSTWLTLGSQSTTGVSGTGVWDGYLNNSIKSVKYYTGLTYAEMIAKTT